MNSKKPAFESHNLQMIKGFGWRLPKFEAKQRVQIQLGKTTSVGYIRTVITEVKKDKVTREWTEESLKHNYSCVMHGTGSVYVFEESQILEVL